MRITCKEMTKTFEQILLKKGFSSDIAHRSAKLFTYNSLDGVYSHGVNRFPRVISYIDKGYIKVNATPSVESRMGGFERWNGNLAMGNTNAESAKSLDEGWFLWLASCRCWNDRYVLDKYIT